MRTVPKWVNKIHEADKVDFSSVYSICFSPDGNQLVIGAGEKVMVYDPRDGALVQLLQAHKGAVYTVAYCGDGKKFASGSADKNVIIWTNKMEGVLKYSHSEAIQCLAYNPVTYQLASCALSDFAFWSAEVKAVQKYRVSGRITCCMWAANGLVLAIGLASGIVSIRDKSGDEIQRVSREAPVWALTFSGNMLLITDWSDTLSFYNLQGVQVMKERKIGISALSIAMMGQLVLVAGVGGWCVLTAEGVLITTTPHEWLWALAPSPAHNAVAVAGQDGTLWCYQVAFSTVHGLYRERYAYREHMTDVIIQHLTAGTKVRIKCHDRVQKIAIYKHRLAVQLPERVVVYEQGDAEGMLYRVKEKLPQKTESSLLVATSDALLLCQDTKLIMIGKKAPRTWTVPAPIRYVKVTTLNFVEVLLLGLHNGQIWQVDATTGSSRLILETPSSVRCVDVSASREFIAVVDETSVCRLYSLSQHRLLYTEENVSSVSWNAWCDDLICLSGGGRLSIKAGRFASGTQPLAGSVVGFQGNRVFCLHSNAMQTINVPLSHAVHQYIQHKMFPEAYSIACLGVTTLDWERLGFAALEEISLEVARKAFQRTENYTFLTLIDQLQKKLEGGENRTVIIGEIVAYRGRYAEAAKAFRSVGRDDRAVDLYVDLRMFNKAQELVSEGEGVAALAARRAQWARHVSSPRAAAEMYLAAGDVARATQTLADNGRADMLLDLSRKLDKGSSESLRHVAAALVKVGETTTAANVYQKLGDYLKVAQLAVAACDWSRAFEIAREHPECRRDVYLPYAHRMADENNFLDAQKAYHMAGEHATAMRVFTTLVFNAVSEDRYSDAGHLHWLLASQSVENNSGIERDMKRRLQEYSKNERLARIYHAYDSVHRCVHEPFSLSEPDMLLNAARCVLALIGEGQPPRGVSLFCTYLCIAKQAKALNATSLAKQMLDKIFGLQIPGKFQESVELLSLKCRASLAGDEEDAMFMCWRCRRQQSPLSTPTCVHCAHCRVHSTVSHEVLPLVEFVPADGIAEEEALELIERVSVKGKDTPESSGGAEVMRIDTLPDSADPFLDKVEEGEESPVVVCSRGALLQLSPVCTIIVRGPSPLPTKYYRNMLPELSVMTCPNCLHLFYMEEYEIQIATKGHCPFCRHGKTVMTARERSGSGDGFDTPTSPSSPRKENGW